MPAVNKAGAVGQYASDAWSLAKRTAVGLNEIRKFINIETKFIDTVQGAATQDATGNVYCISQVAQGLTSATRVGDSVRIQSIEVRGHVLANSAATNTTVRLIIFRDLDGYGTAPATADILEGVGTTMAPFSPEKFNKRERFSILYDQMLMVQGGTTQGLAGTPFYFQTTHQGHILYLAETAATASNGKGSVYVMCLSNEATNTPTLRFSSRVLFTDD